MLSNVFRDAERMPILRELGAYRAEWLVQVEDLLSRDWAGDARQARHAIAVALDFRTWQTLARKRALNTNQAIRLVLAMVDGAAHKPHGQPT